MRHLLPSKIKAPVWVCPICKSRFQRVSPCEDCISKLEPAPSKNALYIYNKVSREMIHGIKYRNCISPISWIATQCLEKISEEVEAIAWIPASQVQKAKRGYDQSKLLAEAISYKINVPYLKLIKRMDDTPQTQRKENRHIGPNLVPSSKRQVLMAVQGKKVLLLDDVITTGTSIKRGELVLKSCGVGSVQTLAIAITNKNASTNKLVDLVR